MAEEIDAGEVHATPESSAEASPQAAQETEDAAPPATQAKSLFERAYGTVYYVPPEQDYPLPPAGAPQRPAGSIGPVAPTTLGLHAQVRSMMLAASGGVSTQPGSFQQDLELHRRMAGQLPLARGDRCIGERGHVCDLSGRRVRQTP